MKINSERKNPKPIGRSELRRHPRKHAGQHVAGSSFGKARVPSGIDPDLTVRPRKDCVETFQKDVCVPPARCFLRKPRASLLNRSATRAQQPRHFSRVRRDRQKLGFALPQEFGLARKGIQSVCVKDNRQWALAHRAANELLSFSLRSESRP